MRAPTFDEAARLRDAGVALELGGHSAGDARERGPDRAEPRRAARAAGARRGARSAASPSSASSSSRRAGCTGRVIAITGTKGQVDDDHADRAGCSRPAGQRVLVGGNIGVPLSAQVDASTRRHGARRRGEQLPARDDRHVPAVDRGAAQLLARSPRSPSATSRRTRPPRRASSRTSARTTWRSSMPTTPRRCATEPRRVRARVMTSSIDFGGATCTSWTPASIGSGTVRGGRRCVPLPQSICSGATC